VEQFQFVAGVLGWYNEEDRGGDRVHRGFAMKKLIALALVLVLIGGCGSNERKVEDTLTAELGMFTEEVDSSWRDIASPEVGRLVDGGWIYKHSKNGIYVTDKFMAEAMDDKEQVLTLIWNLHYKIDWKKVDDFAAFFKANRIDVMLASTNEKVGSVCSGNYEWE